MSRDAVSETPGHLASDAPWRWLAAGWRDLLKAPGISISYGLAFAAVSAGIVYGLVAVDMMYLLLPLAAGFMLVGPMLAVGLYETSRVLEEGGYPTLFQAALVKTASPTQLAYMGALLTIMVLIWVRAATLIYALFFGLRAYPGLQESVDLLFFTADGLAMLAVGSVIGGAIAAVVFAISAFSVPMLMVKDVDIVTAMAASVRAVLRNPGACFVWGWLITMLTAVGIVTFFVGLIVIFPLIGHATWHAYRHAVDGVVPKL